MVPGLPLPFFWHILGGAEAGLERKASLPWASVSPPTKVGVITVLFP